MDEGFKDSDPVSMLARPYLKTTRDGLPLVGVTDQAVDDVLLCLLECLASESSRTRVILDNSRAGSGHWSSRRLAVAIRFEGYLDLAWLFAGVACWRCRRGSRIVVLAGNGCRESDVVWVLVSWVVLGHEVGEGLANALGILVDGRLVVVVLLCVGDHALDVALDGTEGGVSMALELVLRLCVRWACCCGRKRGQST